MSSERANLDAWARAFRRVLGWAPAIADAPGDLPGTVLRFDGPIEPVEMLGSTGHLAQSPALLAHARALGFDWDPQGVVRTVPSPDTFNARADRLLPPGVGYRMGYVRHGRRNMALGGFLLTYLDGRVPVQLAPEEFYVEVARRAGEVTAGELGFHFTSFAHDLSVHALNYQVIPAALREAVRARITEALPERVAAWREPEAPGPLTLTTFFDNDLNRFAYAVWTASESLADAVGIAAAHGAQLLACLDHRIEETRAGLGDVPSGDTADMRPLSPWSFAVSCAKAPPPRPAAVMDEAHRVAIAHALLGVTALPAELTALRARLLDVTLDGDTAVLRVGWEDVVAELRVGEGVTVTELHPSAARLREGLRAMAGSLRGRVPAETLRALPRRA